MHLQHPEWKIESIDFQTELLYGTLNKPIYMNIPEGFAKEPITQYGREHILQLNKTIYGVVQAARAFNNAMDKCLEISI